VSNYDNTNRGAAWKNDKEGGNPNWPDYKGSLNVGGKEYWFDCWIKPIQDGKRKGQKFLSFSVKPKMAQEHRGGTRNPPQRTQEHQRLRPPPDDFDDNIQY
jgi:hypothetical protein